MKNIIILLLLSAFFNFNTAKAQTFECKTLDLKYTNVKPVLDGIEDTIYKNINMELLDRWNNIYTPVVGHSGYFKALYDSANFYLFASVIDTTNSDPGDELSFAFDYDMARNLIYSWENEPKDNNGFFFTKIQRENKDTLGEGKPYRRTYYKFIETAKGYDVELRLAWNEITANATKYNDFLKRKTFLFDVSVKNNNDESIYFAWSNDDHSSWRSSARLGLVTLASTALGVENTVSKEIILYPNPAKEVLYFNGISNNQRIEIINLEGKVLKSEMISNNSLNISSLRPGVYIVKFNNQINSSKLFIKN